MDRGDDVGEIAYLVSRTRQREGIVREALVAVITFAITSNGVRAQKGRRYRKSGRLVTSRHPECETCEILP